MKMEAEDRCGSFYPWSQIPGKKGVGRCTAASWVSLLSSGKTADIVLGAEGIVSVCGSIAGTGEHGRLYQDSPLQAQSRSRAQKLRVKALSLARDMLLPIPAS